MKKDYLITDSLFFILNKFIWFNLCIAFNYFFGILNFSKWKVYINIFKSWLNKKMHTKICIKIYVDKLPKRDIAGYKAINENCNWNKYEY